jgi:hypothetical protein
MTTLISQPASLAPEQWLKVNLSGTQGASGGPDLVVVSGYARFNGISGSDDSDMLLVSYMVEMLVGPVWLRLNDVSPTVHIAGYHSPETDEADLLGYEIHSCTWELPEPPDPKQIRLKVSLSLGGGEKAFIDSLGYHFVARGMLVPGQNFAENT